MDEDKCDLCFRDKNLTLVFIRNPDYYKQSFDKNLCFACNLYRNVFGVRKKVTHFEITKLQFVVEYMDRFNSYCNQYKKLINITEIPKYEKEYSFNKWYKEIYGSDGKMAKFRNLLDVFYSEFGKTNNNNQLVVDIKDKNLFKRWLIDRYYHLKSNYNV